MLTVSPEAAQAITGLVSRPGVPEGAGLKMSPRTEPGEPTAIEVSLADSPTESDQVIEEQGAQVFVANELAPALDDKMLDATVEQDGVNFTLVKQPPADSS
jgi:iron-sulfur cluster assembly protein